VKHLLEYGTLAQLVLLAAMLRFVLWRFIASVPRTSVVVIYLALLLLTASVPLGKYGTLIGMMRGVLGDPSPTLVLLALSYAAGFAWPQSEKKWLYTSLALLGLLFYPLALGALSSVPIDDIARFDPYAYGYQPEILLLFLGALSLYLWRRGSHILLGLLALDLFAYSTHWLESDNLWDYLFDPLLWMIALWQTVYDTARNYNKRRNPT